MHRDDRLFAIIGATVVTAAATFFLVYAAGISGTIEGRPEIVVEPISAATPPDAAALPDLQETTLPPEEPSDLVPARTDEIGHGVGDRAVRTLLTGISTHPQWAAWLVTDDLLTRFVGAVEAVADGYSPTDELGFLAAEGPFLVREHDGRLVIAAGTYRRYNLAVEVLSSIDADDAVAIYRRLEPEIEEIRRGIAWHRGEFEDRLRMAIDHLLAVELPTGPIAVERRTVTYAFADDRFETLSNAQRQLLRMGRANAAAVQATLRELRLAFGWPRVPPADVAPVLVADGGELEPESETAGVAAVIVEAEPMVTPHDPRLGVLSSPLLLDDAGAPPVHTVP
jgi:hypothetical protein